MYHVPQLRYLPQTRPAPPLRFSAAFQAPIALYYPLICSTFFVLLFRSTVRLYPLRLQGILDFRDLPTRLGITEPPPSPPVHLSSAPWVPVSASIPPTSRGTRWLYVVCCFSLFFCLLLFSLVGYILVTSKFRLVRYALPIRTQ